MRKRLNHEELVKLTMRWLEHWRAGLYEPAPLEKERDMWRLTAELLDALACHQGVEAEAGIGVRAMELAATAIRDGLAGKVPPSWGTPAGHVSSPAVKSAIGVAKAYRHVAREKEIKDRRYNVTVAEAFDVPEDTARKWIASPDDPELDEFREALTNFSKAVPGGDLTDYAKLLLQRAGAQYRSLARAKFRVSE